MYYSSDSQPSIAFIPFIWLGLGLIAIWIYYFKRKTLNFSTVVGLLIGGPYIIILEIFILIFPRFRSDQKASNSSLSQTVQDSQSTGSKEDVKVGILPYSKLVDDHLSEIEPPSKRLEEKVIPERKTDSNNIKQLETEVYQLKLSGLLKELKTQIVNRNLLKERVARQGDNAPLSLLNEIQHLDQQVADLETEITKVKAQIAELHKDNNELSENEIKILLTMKNEKGRNPRTARGIRTDTQLPLEIVKSALSVLEIKGLVVKNENRWNLTDKGLRLFASIISQ